MTQNSRRVERINLVTFCAVAVVGLAGIGCVENADLGDRPEDCSTSEVLILAHPQGHPSQPEGDPADDSRYHCADKCGPPGICRDELYCRRYAMGHCWGCEAPSNAWRSRQSYEVCNDAGVVLHSD
jgi:hypothetical protein